MSTPSGPQQLPIDLLVHILSFLRPSEVLHSRRVRGVSVWLRRACMDERYLGSIRALSLSAAEWEGALGANEFLDLCSRLPNLTELSVMPSTTPASRRIIAKAIGVIARSCKQLQSFRARSCHLDVRSIRRLRRGCAASLRRFEATFCDINDRHLSELSRCVQLQHVDVSGATDVSDDGIGQLVGRCPRLRTLRLSMCANVTDASLEHVSDGYSGVQHSLPRKPLPSPLPLPMRRARSITELLVLETLWSLSSWRQPLVAPEGKTSGPTAAAVRADAALELLDVSHTRVSDEGLQLLEQRCPRLRTLLATDCVDVSAAAVRRLVMSTKGELCVHHGSHDGALMNAL